MNKHFLLITLKNAKNSCVKAQQYEEASGFRTIERTVVTLDPDKPDELKELEKLEDKALLMIDSLEVDESATTRTGDIVKLSGKIKNRIQDSFKKSQALREEAAILLRKANKKDKVTWKIIMKDMNDPELDDYTLNFDAKTHDVMVLGRGKDK